MLGQIDESVGRSISMTDDYLSSLFFDLLLLT